VVHDQNGLVVPPKDPVALANAFLAGSDETRWRVLANGARASFAAGFAPEAIRSAWISLIESLH
jgi:glycosyltransferase involved in cell wall biosynthesis